MAHQKMIRKNKKENVVGTKSGSTGWHDMYHESHSATAPFPYSQECKCFYDR